jgi:hypothetical protein
MQREHRIRILLRYTIACHTCNCLHRAESWAHTNLFFTSTAGPPPSTFLYRMPSCLHLPEPRPLDVHRRHSCMPEALRPRAGRWRFINYTHNIIVHINLTVHKFRTFRNCIRKSSNRMFRTNIHVFCCKSFMDCDYSSSPALAWRGQ